MRHHIQFSESNLFQQQLWMRDVYSVNTVFRRNTYPDIHVTSFLALKIADLNQSYWFIQQWMFTLRFSNCKFPLSCIWQLHTLHYIYHIVPYHFPKTMIHLLLCDVAVEQEVIWNFLVLLNSRTQRFMCYDFFNGLYRLHCPEEDLDLCSLHRTKHLWIIANLLFTFY